MASSKTACQLPQLFSKQLQDVGAQEAVLLTVALAAATAALFLQWRSTRTNKGNNTGVTYSAATETDLCHVGITLPVCETDD